MISRRGVVDTLVVDGDDPGMVQPRSSTGFPFETLQEDGVGGEPRRHHLDGDGSLQAGVRAAVDGGHPAAGQDRAHPVAPIEKGADQVPVLAGPLLLHSPDGTDSCSPNGGRAQASGYGMVTTVRDLPIVPDVLDPEVVVLPLPDVAQRLGLPLSRVYQMLRDWQLLGIRRHGVPVVPAEFLHGSSVVKGLPGTITLLRDAGYSAEEILRWLFTAEESLPGTPIAALRTDRGREVKRRAQAMGF